MSDEIKHYKVSGVVTGVIMEATPEDAVDAFESAFATHNIPHFIPGTTLASEITVEEVPK